METCQTCHDPLVLSLDDSDTDEAQSQPIPDDLLLPCGCHFHWQCLLDQSPTISLSLTCPSCSTYLPTNTPGPSATNQFLPTTQSNPIPAIYTSEGGASELDILPLLTEEAFLSAHPEARPARALHTMAAEGDISGMASLLADIDGDDDVDASAGELLRWTDPLNGGKTALHVAVEQGQEEVFWLVLWLGSAVATELFPEAVVRSAEGMGMGRREAAAAGEDVRFVVDGMGRGPAEVMVEKGEPWRRYVEGGLFG